VLQILAIASAMAAVCALHPIPIRQQRLAARLIQSIPCIVLLACACRALPVAAQADGADYVFDLRMFRGTVNDSLLARLGKPQTVLPGAYGLDVWINQQFVDRLTVTFQERGDGGAAPCLTPDQFQRLGILLSPPDAAAQVRPASACLDIVEHVPGVRAAPRLNVLRLDLQVPQAQLRRAPRGTVNPEDMDVGVTVGFVNYMGNYYHAWQRIAGRQSSAYLSLQSGVNLGLWQLRHQSSANWTQQEGVSWKSVRTYVQRPLLAMRSQLVLGQTYTRGKFFSGLNYVGMSLSTDESMLPDSQRGYAPVVRGVASSNALVSIRQNGTEIYRTTVAPGAFEISDLYPNSASGDLEVQVQEADGATARYAVPFSAVPESLREGQWRYEAALGRTHEPGSNSVFGDGVVQRGLSNAATAYGGLRLAQGYQAFMAGGVYASRMGALGADLTWSRARLPQQATDSGWMLRLSYSNTIAVTGTTVTLANYRYSSQGYQDLGNVLGRRSAGAQRAADWQQRNRLDLRLNQKLGTWGYVFASGAVQEYRGSRSRDVQYQLGYGTVLNNGVSANVALLRQHIHGASAAESAGQWETTLMVSLSIPLGARLPSFNTTITTGSSRSAQTQGTFSGALDAEQTLGYSLGGSFDRQSRQAVWNGNLQKRFTKATVGVGASISRGTRQVSANAQGALAVHAGGVTFGSYLGDTFALVEAPGATGARLLNSQTRIDANGYALLPTLTPYRYNSVMLDPGGMPVSVELASSEQRVAPYGGAAVKLKFETRSGRALLIRTVTQDGTPAPFGAEVFDESGAPVGIVGQGGRIYVRAQGEAGQLTVRWGQAASEQCLLAWNIGAQAQDQALVRLQGVCARAGRGGGKR